MKVGIRSSAMIAALGLALAAFAAPPAAAQEGRGGAADAQAHHHHAHGAAPKAPSAAPARMAVPDTPVFDQDGRPLRFYSDLIKGRTVAINFVFTTCTTICPPLAATFAQVQRLAGDRMGKEFHLISISVDPVTDTPERLKAWAAKFNAGPNWTLVTGDKQEIDRLLKALGGFTARIEDHTPLLLIGNETDGVWTRAYGLAPPATIVKLLEDAAAGAFPPAQQEVNPR